MNAATQRHQGGFTLIEIIVAISVFAVIAAAMLVALNQVLNGAATSRRALDRLADLQRTFVVMGQDLRQTADRPARSAMGDSQPAFSVEANTLEFTRGGSRRLRQRQGSELQRVAYRLSSDGELTRLSWPRVDRDQRSEPVRQVLLDDIDSWRLRYHSGGQWHDDWPPRAGARENDDSLPAYPDAVAVRLEMAPYGPVERSFELP